MTAPGLTSLEAQKRLLQFGPNEIVEARSFKSLNLFLAQFTNLLTLLLILAALTSLVLKGGLDGLMIILILLLNGVLGFFQENKAEQALRKLKKISWVKSRVRRDGQEILLDSRQLVPGDLIFVEAGGKIPADGRISEAQNLEVDEASLSGESLPVPKIANAPSDEGNLFAGTVVARGRAQAIIVATGKQSRFGQMVQSLSQIREEPTPLQKRLAALGRQLGLLSLAAGALVFLITFLRGTPILTALLTAVSLAVAAVPEGLPTVVVVTLAVGTQRMARARAIVRKLSAVEALGSTSLILSDKTGTLTQNRMRVRRVFIDGRNHSVTDLEKNSRLSFEKLNEICSLCNTASLVFKHDHDSFDVLGDTTEGGLLLLVHDLNQNPNLLREKSRLWQEFSFDANLKRMSVLVEKENQLQLLTKGAPEAVLPLCDHLLQANDRTPLSDAERETLLSAFYQLANLGLRVLCLAYRKLDAAEKKIHRESLEKNLTFVALLGLADPPRPEAAKAIKLCQQAGIRVVMVTGDNELTANAVATELDLIHENEDILLGDQIKEFSDDNLKRLLPRTRIFARTAPEDKLRLVKAYQEMGEVVAVTGDGVNDALALKQADVGVAMGLTGTDVAKEVADLVLTDDNFATLVSAVEEGRAIFANVQSAVKYLLSSNAAEVFSVLLASLLGWPLLLTPAQILYINLATDGLPALVLALRPKSAETMRKKPQKLRRLMERRDLPWFLEMPLATTLITLIAFALAQRFGLNTARTLALTVLVFAQNFIWLDLYEPRKSIFKISLRKDLILLVVFLLPFALQLFLIFSPAAPVLNLQPLSPDLLLTAFLLPFVLLALSELRKAFLKPH